MAVEYEEQLVLVKVIPTFDFTPIEAKEVVEAILKEHTDENMRFVVLLIERETS